jgi:hypothetical protein
MTRFFILGAPDSIWGDYGDILMNGMSCHLERENNLIQLERTGPFIPPISFPGIGDLVITDSFKKQLQKSDLIGLRFQPVIKKHIVHLDWHLWDKSSEEPAEYPVDGEPESYILENPHSKKISQKLGDLWEIQINKNASIHRGKDIELITSTWKGEDLFGCNDVGYVYATEKAKDWLEKQVPEYVNFRETNTRE